MKNIIGSLCGAKDEENVSELHWKTLDFNYLRELQLTINSIN